MSRGAWEALFCTSFALIGVAHILFPRFVKLFWSFVFFPFGIEYEYEESMRGYQLIGGIFFVIAGIVGFYAIR